MNRVDRRKIDPSVGVSDLETALEEYLSFCGSRDLNDVFSRLSRILSSKGHQAGLQNFSEYHRLFLLIALAVKTGKIPGNKLQFAIQSMPQDVEGKLLNTTNKPIHQLADRLTSLIVQGMAKYRELICDLPRREAVFRECGKKDIEEIQQVLEAIGPKVPVDHGDETCDGGAAELAPSVVTNTFFGKNEGSDVKSSTNFAINHTFIGKATELEHSPLRKKELGLDMMLFIDECFLDKVFQNKCDFEIDPVPVASVHDNGLYVSPDTCRRLFSSESLGSQSDNQSPVRPPVQDKGLYVSPDALKNSLSSASLGSQCSPKPQKSVSSGSLGPQCSPTPKKSLSRGSLAAQCSPTPEKSLSNGSVEVQCSPTISQSLSIVSLGAQCGPGVASELTEDMMNAVGPFSDETLATAMGCEPIANNGKDQKNRQGKLVRKRKRVIKRTR